jgi:hypothetical protein
MWHVCEGDSPTTVEARGLPPSCVVCTQGRMQSALSRTEKNGATQSGTRTSLLTIHTHTKKKTSELEVAGAQERRQCKDELEVRRGTERKDGEGV